MKNAFRVLIALVAMFCFAALAGCDEGNTTSTTNNNTHIIEAPAAPAPEATADSELPQPTPVPEPPVQVVEDPVFVPDPDVLFVGLPADPYKYSVRAGEQDVDLAVFQTFCRDNEEDNRVGQMVFLVDSAIAAKDIFKEVQFMVGNTIPWMSPMIEMKGNLIILDFNYPWSPSGCDWLNEHEELHLVGDIRTDIPTGVSFGVRLIGAQPHAWGTNFAGNPGGNFLTVRDADGALPVLTTTSSTTASVIPSVLTDIGGFELYCETQCSVEDLQIDIYGSSIEYAQVMIQGVLRDLHRLPNGRYQVDPSWGLGDGNTISFRVLVMSSGEGLVWSQVHRMSLRVGDRSVLVGPRIGSDDPTAGWCSNIIGGRMECVPFDGGKG